MEYFKAQLRRTLRGPTSLDEVAAARARELHSAMNGSPLPGWLVRALRSSEQDKVRTLRNGIVENLYQDLLGQGIFQAYDQEGHVLIPAAHIIPEGEAPLQELNGKVPARDFSYSQRRFSEDLTLIATARTGTHDWLQVEPTTPDEYAIIYRQIANRLSDNHINR